MERTNRRVAVVTGAASGIGRALARSAAARRMDIVLADIDGAGLENTRLELLRHGVQIITSVTDVSAEGEVRRLADRTREEFGAVDYLFNNAGICVLGSICEVPSWKWRSILEINVMGVVHGIGAFLPLMNEQQRPGHIINTASIVGLFTSPGGGAYAATKHAVIAISECLFSELRANASKNHVSVVCPSFVDTNLARSSALRLGEQDDQGSIQSRQALEAQLASGRSPGDLAEFIFDAAQERRFWIVPDREALGGLDLRHTSIKNQTDPIMPTML